jgi:hypothetical protein
VFLLLIHHFDGDIRAIGFTLITTNASRFFHDLILFKKENLFRADFDTKDAALAIDLIPLDVESRFHSKILAGRSVPRKPRPLGGVPACRQAGRGTI